MLVTFRVPEQQVAAQAEVVRQSAVSAGTSATDSLNAARRQVTAAVKARVLGPAVFSASGTSGGNTTSGTVTPTTAVQQPAQAQGGVRVLSDYPLMPVTLVSISSSAELARLRANPEVASVVADGVVRPLETMAGLDMIGQPAVLAQGYAGVGTVVTLDTGVDYTQDAFGPCTAPGVPAATCKVLYTEDLAATNSVDNSHGTNVAGIVVGVAPGSRIISLDVFEADGSAYYSTLIAGMEWAVANKTKYNITVVNLSLGADNGDQAGPCPSDPMAAPIATAWASGIISVVAAGNDGYANALSAPACVPKAVSVGAVYTENFKGTITWTLQRATGDVDCTDTNPTVDSLACFSNSGAQLTMLAPGAYNITAAGVSDAGTSQATPFISGSITVLTQVYPTYTPQQILDRLTSTGVPITDPRNNLAKPRLDLQAAVGAITPTCTVTVSPASVTAAAGGGTYSLQVTASSASCSWTVSVAGATWLAPTPASGSGTAAVVLQASANSGAARSAVVTVTATDGSATATVQQDAGGSISGGVPLSFVVALTGVVAGRSSVQLKWAPGRSQDTSTSTTYKVVFNVGATAPQPHCGSGTPVAKQPAAAPSSTAHGGTMYRMRVTGLQPSQRYTFRVCAVDSSGRVSRGTVWRGSTTG